MEALDVEKPWDCFNTNSEASKESQTLDSSAEEEQLKTDAALLVGSLMESVSMCKPSEQSDISQSDQKQTKELKHRESGHSGDSTKHTENSDRTEPSSSSTKDGVKRPFQLNDNMKKGLSMLAYPSKGARPRSKPLNKGPQQSQTKSKCRITIGETLEKVQDIRNSLGGTSKELEASSESANIEDQSVVLSDSGEVPSPVLSDNAEIGAVNVTSESGDIKAQVREKENWTTATPVSLISKDRGTASPTTTPEERIPLAAKPRAPATRFKLTPRMWELLRFTFSHEHFPTSVHMARLAKMMGIQWSQVRNWFTNRRVENKKAGIFPRDKVLTDCPYCGVSLKTEAEQKGHLFASHHVKSILGPEFVGDLEPIKWKKFPTSINAINKLSGARVLAIGYSADTEADSQETLTGALESSTHTSDTLLEALATDSGKTKSRKLRKTWQESMGLQPKSQGSSGHPKVISSPAKGTKELSPLPHSSLSPSQRSDSVVYLKMESGEEKAIATKDSEEKAEDSGSIHSDRLLPNRTVSCASLAETFPVVYPGDPCTSKSNISQEVEKSQIPKTEKEETDIETIQVDQPQRSHCIVGGSQENVDTELNIKTLTAVPSTPQELLCSDLSSSKDALEVEKAGINVEEGKKKNVLQKTKTNDSSKIYNCNSSANSLSPPKVISQKENILVDVARESGSKPKSSTGLSTLDATIPDVPSSLDIKENTKYFPKYAWNRIEPIRYKLQENVGDEYVNIGYQCPTCNKVFVTEWQMMKHSITHFKFQCDVCEQSFSSEGSLKDHLHEHLTTAYEDEKYYCQFSCKICHSLKCECFEPLYIKAEEILRTYKRPQKARRSSKVFLSKPNSGPNDHLRVTLGSYKKSLQQMHFGSKTKGTQHQTSQATQQVLLRNMSHPLQKTNIGHIGTVNSDQEIIGGVNLTRLRGEVPNSEENQGYHEYSSTGLPALSVRNDLLITTPEGAISETHLVTLPMDMKTKPDRRRRPLGSRKRTAKLSSNFIYKDTDFYFMCEMCDASFLSKAELSEHMFFHRLKSRSRRGEKRRLTESVQEEENTAKRFKEEDLQINEEVVTINVGGFERFKCPLCKGHFASVTDLNRHRTQAHKDNEIIPSVNESIAVPCLEMLQCNFCNRLYRRERELRRHLKHDCLAAPEDLKNKLSVGISLTSLHEMGDGPYYSKVQRNSDDASVHHEYGTRMSPHKGPITCRYCLTVTRREAEMKRHIWKYCNKIPKAVIKMFKDGASLEELGFITGSVKVEPVTETVISHLPKPIAPTSETMDVDIESPALTSEPLLPNQTPAVPVINPTSFATSSKSKGPLICTYCGIWYFREVSLLKHMKERCIKISLEEKELLQMGAGLCTYTPEVTPEVCGPSEKQGTFKIVNRNQLPLTPVKKEDPEPQETSPVLNQQEELQPVKLEPEETGPQVEMSPPKSPLKVPLEKVTPSQPPAPKARKNSRCRRCHDTYSSHEAVLAHSSVHHGPKKGFYKCKLCQVKIAKYKQLREHVWEHTNETPYKCHLCDTKFRTSDSIIEHLDSLHNYKEINERNLYKWLPGRNGKYREIKEVNKSAEREETLVDVNASLDSLAEVMVVTDKDIWTGRSSDSASPRKKSTHNVSGSESSSVESSPVGQKTNVRDKSETLTTPPPGVGTTQKDGKAVFATPEELQSDKGKVSRSPGKGNLSVSPEEKLSQQSKGERIPVVAVESEDSDCMMRSITDESSEKTTSEGSNQVKTVRRRVRKKSVPPELSKCKENQNTRKRIKPSASESPRNKETTKQIHEVAESSRKVALNSEDKSSSGEMNTDSSEDERAKKTAVPGSPPGKGRADKDNSKKLDISVEGSEDNGDGLLSCVENLESVIETVQLTDNYLSS